MSQASTTSSRTSYGQNCISFLASSVCNNLSNELKRCTNLNTFKHKIKENIFCKIRHKITISIFTTRLLSSQQMMHFFSNFSCFFFTFYSVLVYQFCSRSTTEIKQLECFSCVILATN